MPAPRPTCRPDRLPTPRPAPARAVLAVVVGLLMAGSALLSGAGPASASTGDLLARTGSARAAAGLAPLAPAGDLAAVARAWAETMAADGSLRHNPDLTSQVSGWSAVAENVGTGGDVASVFEALMASPGHRANVLGPYTQVGVGLASGGGAVWVVQVFRTPAGTAAAAVAPAPVAPAVPNPAPAPPVRAPAAVEPADPSEPVGSGPTEAADEFPAARPGPRTAPETATSPDAAVVAAAASARLRAVGGPAPWRVGAPFSL